MKTIDFKKLVGQTASLYYNNEVNTFQLGSVLFEVIEDENDGYRSACAGVQIIKIDALRGEFLAEIAIQESGDIDGFDLIDSLDGFTWLTFGTDNSDSYYPCFKFYRNAKPPIEEQILPLIK